MMLIQSVAFRRNEDSEWENGIMIHDENMDNNLIVDMNAKAVDQSVWDIEYDCRLVVNY